MQGEKREQQESDSGYHVAKKTEHPAETRIGVTTMNITFEYT